MEECKGTLEGEKIFIGGELNGHGSEVVVGMRMKAICIE